MWGELPFKEPGLSVNRPRLFLLSLAGTATKRDEKEDEKAAEKREREGGEKVEEEWEERGEVGKRACLQCNKHREANMGG